MWPFWFQNNISYGRQPLLWKMTSPMEDDLSYERWPLLWKTTTPMADNLYYGIWPILWKTTSPMEDDISYRRRPFLWKTTFYMEDDHSYGRKPLLWKATSPMEDDLQKWYSGPKGTSLVAKGHQPSVGARRRPPKGAEPSSFVYFLNTGPQWWQQFTMSISLTTPSCIQNTIWTPQSPPNGGPPYVLAL